MRKKIEIKIGGKSYPCRPTMGAMLRFHELTGREVTDIQPQSITDLLTYLYCCVASASKADGVAFGMELMDFADAIAPDDMNEWASALTEAPTDEQPRTAADGAEGQKKSR